MIFIRFGGVFGEPGMIEALRIVFIGSREMPAMVPNLHPSMIAAFVPPHRRAGGACGNSNGTADINQDDRKPRASGFALGDGFLG